MNAQLLEAVYAAIVVGCAVAVVLVVRYLVIEVRKHGLERYRAQAAVSLLVLFTGQFAMAGSIWWVRYRANSGLPPDWFVTHQDWFIASSATVLLLGLLCYIRVWSPEKWGAWPWLGTAAVMAAFALAGPVAAACALLLVGIAFFFWFPPG